MAGSVILLHGEDAFAVASARRKLESELVDPVWRDFNLTVLDGSATGRQILTALLTVPFGGGNRLVIVKDAACVQAGKGEDASLAELEATLAEGLPDGAHLVLTAPKADARLRLVKAVEKHGRVLAFEAPKPWQLEERLAPWVESEVASRKRRIDSNAVGLLIRSTGGDRFRLMREIEKLTTAAPEGGRIDGALVRTLVAGGEADVFALTDALARKRAADALVTVGRLLTTDHGLKVLAATATIVRGWWRLKVLSEQGLSAQAIAQATGARSDFKVRKDLELLRAWDAASLAAALATLTRLDADLKAGAWPADAQRARWETAIAQLLIPPDARLR